MTTKKTVKGEDLAHTQPLFTRENQFKVISWGITIIATALLVVFGVTRSYAARSATANPPPSDPALVDSHITPTVVTTPFTVPLVNLTAGIDAIVPLADAHTIAPTASRESATTYIVAAGDSIFGIAQQFNIKPETILWANYNNLKDNPDMISIGLKLTIPPTDGIYYQWQDGDTFDTVASAFKTTADAILSYPGNGFDMTNPVVQPGEYVMVVGGSREFHQWLVPTIPRGPAGVAATVLGPGACSTSVGGYYGSGSFIWPTSTHFISGNDYTPYHLGIDIGASMGSPVYAADTGIVVYSGWSNQGYGNMVMIDHGDGYQTLYGHLSQLEVSCGQGVLQGGLIAYSGSTGNSTGPHLHFEVRYEGGFINPHDVLP